MSSGNHKTATGCKNDDASGGVTSENSAQALILTAEDFVDADFVMVRPALVRKFRGDVAAVLMIARIQFRCQVQEPDADGIRWWKATYADLSKETGLSPDQAKRTIEKLVEKKIVLGKIENGSAWDRTKSYRVDVRSVHLAIPPNASDGSARSNRAESPDLLSTQEALKNLRTNAHPAPSEQDLFDKFWSVYPAKKGKIAARKAWAKALRSAAADTITAGAMIYRADSRVLAGFIKDPATWLNGGHWDDELSVEPTRTPTAARDALVPFGDMHLTPANAQMFGLLDELRMDEEAAAAHLTGFHPALEGGEW